MPQQSKDIEIQVNDDIAQGVFANLVIINHTDAEFAMDFVYLQPSVSKGKVRSRVIMTPAHVKRFLHALQDNLQKFESKHNEIKTIPPAPPQDVHLKDK